MRFSAHALLRSYPKKIFILSLLVLFFAFASFHTYAFAQTYNDTTSTDEFRQPAVDSNVPRNTHTYTQILLIDILSATICQLSGIDPINPKQGCVGFNPQTGKFAVGAYDTTTASAPHVGGALGFVASQIGVLYQQPISATTYMDYMAANFGILPKAYAQNAQQNCSTAAGNLGYGACGLMTIFELWKFVRDLSYAILVIAFVILALGIMLRFKANPQTVMTLQNQIPRVIISILLITFSYAIAGFMIDLMWTTTYMGMAAITQTAGANNITICDGTRGTEGPLSLAQRDLIQTPLSFVHNLFSTDCRPASGLVSLGNDVGGAIGNIVTTFVMQAIGLDYNAATEGCSIGITGFDFGGCFKSIISFVISLVIKLIVIVALLITLMRLWFQLLKTVVLFIIYTIMGPLWIVFGLIPGRPLGFEKWLREEFAHLAPFAVVAWMLTLARVLAGVYSTASPTAPQTMFIPPLIGNPNMNNFGVLLAFGIILLTPGIPEMIKSKMKVPSGNMGAQIRGGLAAGAIVTGKTGGKGWNRLTRRYDPETGRDAGPLRQFAYGRILGMNKASVDKSDPTGKRLIPTRKYRWARKLMGGSLGVEGEGKKRG